MNAFRFEKALAKDENGNFIPAADLVWNRVNRRMIPGGNNLFESYDEANVARIEMQKNSNKYYFRIAK
jgi:hypothetical protein